MDKLLFENPSFNIGLNLTVRRGIKWAIQKRVMLANLHGQEIGEENIETRVLRFCDLTDADLVLEHDGNCRTVDGLFSVMKQIYPNFDRRELVTLVYFSYGHA